MTKFVDYKATIWFRIPVDDEGVPIVTKQLIKGVLPSGKK